MNLTGIANLIKQKRALAAVVLLLVLVLVVAFLSARPAPKPPTPIEQPQIGGFLGQAQSFETSELTIPENLPESLPVFTLQARANFLSQAGELAEKLGFGGKAKNIRDVNLGEGLVYSESQASLLVYNSVIAYQKTLKGEAGQAPDLEFLKSRAKSFFASLNLDTSQLTKPATTFLKLSGEDLVETPDQNQANFVKFDYPANLFGLPVLPRSNLVSATLGLGGEVVSFNYREFDALPVAGAQDQLIKDFRQALEELKAGQGSLVEIAGEAESLTTIANLGEVKLKKAYLAYYLPSKTQASIQPVWAFKGEGEVRGIEVETLFVIPAVT